MAEYSKHQQKIIRRYYDNRQSIALQKLGELVTELYLVESDRKREQLWKRVESHMGSLGVPASIAEHILAGRDVKVLAANLQDWMSKPPS
jgi:hypothetical protein